MTMTIMDVAHALTLMLVTLALTKPTMFRFLIDKGSGMPSLGKQGQFVALVTSTWAFATLTVAHELTEWFFGAYMVAWAGAAFGSLWLQIKGGQQGSSSTTTTTTSSSASSQPAQP